MTSKPTRRHDPERRSRIIAATLDVIAEQGVDGTSHRRVAAAAGVVGCGASVVAVRTAGRPADIGI